MSTPEPVISAVPDLSVLIAVLDEEETLRNVLDELIGVLDGEVEFEVVVVDDGSQDGTLKLVRRLVLDEPRLVCIAHPENRGKSAALITAALAARGHWIATMDGDGQNDPADLLALYREVVATTERHGGRWIAAGCRRRRRDHWFKRLQSRCANHVRRTLLHDVTPDAGCGLKALGRETFLGLPRFAHMHRFLPALVQQSGGQVVSVMVEDRQRMGGVSKYGFGNRAWAGMVDLLGVIWLGRRTIQPVEVREFRR